MHAILRAADELIARGGRTLLAKILRGSRCREVLLHHLDQNPAHGFYAGVPEDEVLARIDWMILHRYLQIVYEGQMPVLVFTPRGWEIERENYACELVRGFDTLLARDPGPYLMDYLKDRNRPMMLLVLDKVQASGYPKYLPLLDYWARIDYPKIQLRVREVMAHLQNQI